MRVRLTATYEYEVSDTDIANAYAGDRDNVLKFDRENAPEILDNALALDEVTFNVKEV